MPLNWTSILDKHLKDLLGGGWPPTSQAALDLTHDLAAKWLAGDNTAVEKAIKDALNDDTLSEKEIIGILSLIARGWTDDKFFGNDFVQRMLVALSDGDLTSGEIADVAAEWAANKTDNDALKQLIKAASDGHLSRDEVEAAVLTWVKKNGPSGLDAKLKAILDAPDAINLRSVVMLTVSFLVSEDKVTDPITTIDKQIRVIADTLEKYVGADLLSIIKALANNDRVGAARIMLKKMGVTVKDAVIQQILQGKFADVAKDFLTGALKRAISGITDEQAASLTEVITKIVTGKVELIPAKSEQDELAMTDWEYNIWARVRKVLYAAKMAMSNDPIVSADPMARPHVFAAAAIGLSTAVKSLSTQQDDKELQRLVDVVWSFTFQEFKNEPGGNKYKNDPPIFMDTLKAGATAQLIFADVTAKLD